MHCDCNAPNFSVKGGADMQIKKNKKLLFSLGIVFLVIGFAILSVFVYKRISRELYKQKLLRECVVFEVPSLDIKVPVMDGTDKKYFLLPPDILKIPEKLASEITVLPDITAQYMRKFSTI